jgi:hypothetical protein
MPNGPPLPNCPPASLSNALHYNDRQYTYSEENRPSILIPPRDPSSSSILETSPRTSYTIQSERPHDVVGRGPPAKPDVRHSLNLILNSNAASSLLNSNDDVSDERQQDLMDGSSEESNSNLWKLANAATDNRS